MLRITKTPVTSLTLKNITRRPFITVINQGFEAQRTFFGKNPKKLNPGIHVFIPFAHRIIKVDMREGQLPVNDLHAYTRDNVPVIISGTLFYRLIDSYKACFSAQEVHEQVASVGTSAVRSIVGTMDYDKIIAERNEINIILANKIEESCSAWGVNCNKFEIQGFGPQNKNVEKQLELQMEEERKRRAQILNTEANVNIADGDMRAIILRSRGELEASKNKAEADMIVTMKNADADKYSRNMEAMAWADQVKRLTEAMNGDSVGAVDFMITQARLAYLKSIASGPNNNTYFLPNQGNEMLPGIKIFADMLKPTDPVFNQSMETESTKTRPMETTPMETRPIGSGSTQITRYNVPQLCDFS